jgi:hypothetical protein
MIREAEIESYFVAQVRVSGGEPFKFTSPGRRHVPDRMILWPGGRVRFVELKAPGRKPSLGQHREHQRFAAKGSPVQIIDSKAGVDAWIDEVCGP